MRHFVATAHDNRVRPFYDMKACDDAIARDDEASAETFIGGD
jgi:hypothetical protein